MPLQGVVVLEIAGGLRSLQPAPGVCGSSSALSPSTKRHTGPGTSSPSTPAVLTEGEALLPVQVSQLPHMLGMAGPSLVPGIFVRVPWPSGADQESRVSP